MCSYQNVSDVNSVNFLNENWEQEVWANVLSPNSNLCDTNTDQHQCSQIPTDRNSVGNETSSATSQNCQVQIATVYQNVKSSSLLSPTWEDSAHETSQSTTNMSTYFSTFNPMSQMESEDAAEDVTCLPRRYLFNVDLKMPRLYISGNKDNEFHSFALRMINLSDIQMYQSPMMHASPNSRPQNYSNKISHRARINFVPSANGTFKAIVKRKRKRTVFTSEQLEILEQVFSKKPYVTRDDRQLLVEQLQVNDKSIKVWFQNRRLKNKRVYEDRDVMEADNNSIFDRIEAVESQIKERTDEFGYVTLDDEIVNDLVNVIDDYFTSKISPVKTKTEIGSSPLYEPISPASTSDYSGDETSWQPYEPNDTLEKLMDIDSIISV